MDASPTPPLTLYVHPLCPSCRPLLVFAADHDLPIEWRTVERSACGHLGAVSRALTSRAQVPVLLQDDFLLTGTTTILRYLAGLADSPAYPRDARQRARVDERMDWFRAGLARELACGGTRGGTHPGMLAQHRRPDAASRSRVARLLDVLDAQLIGPHRSVLVGERITLADYLGLGVLTARAADGIDFGRWPNVRRWLAHLQDRPAPVRTQAAFERMEATPAARGRDVR